MEIGRILPMAGVPTLPALTPLPPMSALSSLDGVAVTAGGSGDSGAKGSAATFDNVLSQFLGSHTQAQAKASQAIEALATGQTDNLHAVSMAVAEADLTFRLILEMRNRLTEAYQEVMRMQI